MRKCKQCKAVELRPAAKCENILEKKGYCSVKCLNQHTIDKRISAQEKKERKVMREAKEKFKTLAQHVTDTQSHVNRLVVYEDRLKGCISCGSTEVSDAGHFFHKGSKYKTDMLTLFRLNLNGQCQACNRFKGGGNQYEYQKGFIARYGVEKFNELEEFKRSTDRGEVPKLTIEECKRIAKDAKAKLKALKTNSI